MKYLIGVDGGATKTTAVIIDKDNKKEIVTHSTGSSNKNSVGNDVAKKHIIDAINGAMMEGNISISDGTKYQV